MKVLTLAVLLIIAATATFALGRTTARKSGPEIPAETNGKDVTLRIGDQVRVPAVALFCVISVELDIPRVLCNRTGLKPRYQVRFERDRTEVGRIGYPGDQKVFPER